MDISQPLQSQPMTRQPAQPQKPAPAVAQAQKKPDPSDPRKVKFSVGRDYQVINVVGEGAYGVVVRAVHRGSGKEVAIKKVSMVTRSLLLSEEKGLMRFFGAR
jgi:mitogen-activated protein kinase 1/3